ncbi:pncT, partial [Streptococcus pneumoniae]|nr:pncT [Streptococcus pneumoniae]
MEKIDYITLNEVELETISGGDDCFIGDIGCIGWGLLKSIGG